MRMYRGVVGLVLLTACGGPSSGPHNLEPDGSYAQSLHKQYAESQKNAEACKERNGLALTDIAWDSAGHEFHTLKECVMPAAPCTPAAHAGEAVMLKKPSNKPRMAIIAQAEQAITDNGGPTLARVFYKYDCAKCGSREKAPEPNVLPAEIACAVCGALIRILGGGFQLHVRRAVSVSWDEPQSTLTVRKQYESDKGDA